jgi:hypothetical protein
LDNCGDEHCVGRQHGCLYGRYSHEQQRILSNHLAVNYSEPILKGLC